MAGEAMPPPQPRAVKRKAAEVLDEDTYTQAIEAIIERDFFPDIPKLQSQLEWMEALKSGDPAVIRRAQITIARRRAGLRTPAPGAGATPAHRATSGWRTGTGVVPTTPAMTPLVQPGLSDNPTVHGGATPALHNAAMPAHDIAAATGDPAASAIEARAPPLRLDAFLSSYTGEDNASFTAILEADNTRKLARHAYLMEPPGVRNTRGVAAARAGPPPPALAALPAAPAVGTGSNTAVVEPKLGEEEQKAPNVDPGLEQGTEDARVVPRVMCEPDTEPSSTVLTSWKYNPKSSLYYDATQRGTLEYSTGERAAMVPGPPREVVLSNTRLPRSHEEEQERAVAAATARLAAAPSGAELCLPAQATGELATATGPSNRGYGYLATPSLVPGVEASPLMTWGDVEATPLRLDAPDDLGALGNAVLGAGWELSGGASAEGALAFRLPEVRRRELAAAAALASRGGRAAASTGRAIRGGRSTPTLEALRASSARTPGTPLSDAARRLASSMRGAAKGGKGLSVGQQHRHNSVAVPTPYTGGADVGLDKQLRASYASGKTPLTTGRSSAAGTHAANTSGTPLLQGATPAAVKGLTPRAEAAGSQAGRAPTATLGPPPGTGGCITDNLLKLL